MKNFDRKKMVPVVIFCYLRKDHLKKTLDSLSENILAKETDIYIYSDGEKNFTQTPKVIELREFLKNYNRKNCFNKFFIIESKKNKGLANSIIQGVSEIIKKYGKVIVLEDDLVTSKYFLTYMNDALEKYEKIEKIWNISGYTPNLNLKKDKENYFFIKRPWSWGWGTWLDRWNKVDWELEDFQTFMKDKEKKEEFINCGKDLLEMLIAQKQNRQYIDSWYIKYAYNQYNYNGLTLYSKKSFIKNIGIDGSGTHSSKGNANKWSVLLKDNYSSKELPEKQEIMISQDISKQFKNIKNADYIKGRLMRVLDNLYLYKLSRKIQKKMNLLTKNEK